jgi:hypothetical protein
MYISYEGDDDCDSVLTRGQDIRNLLRRTAQTVDHIQDESAREAISELVDALRVVSNVLYDLSEPPHRRLTPQPSGAAPYSLS